MEPLWNNICHQCNQEMTGRCRCLLGDMTCVNDHHWRIGVDGEKLILNGPHGDIIGVIHASPSSASAQQPIPTGDGAVVLYAVVTDLEERAKFGEKKYGTMLKTQNGRDALQDAYEEAVDLVMYLKQEIMQREEYRNAK